MDGRDELYYIVAGDEMQRLMRLQFPHRKTIAFREDFSKGERVGFPFDEAQIGKRATFWKVSKEEYLEKLSPILDVDMTKTFVLCFGEDACCRANLAFMLGYLRYKGYSQAVKVQIVDEYTLCVQKEYFVGVN